VTTPKVRRPAGELQRAAHGIDIGWFMGAADIRCDPPNANVCANSDALKNKVCSLRSIKRWFALHSIRVLNNNTNRATIHGFHLFMSLPHARNA